MNSFRIGLFGFGTVGRGLYDVLKRLGTDNVEICHVCVKHKEKHQDADILLTDQPDDVFQDSRVNFIVELIDDAQAAYDIVCRALRQGLPVVSGNKKMLARHLPELIRLQEETGTALLYDASACGSIPVIRNLEEYYDNDLLQSVKGILNGSSNFILSKIFNEGMSYPDALKLAQDLGFAESNPTLDIDGWDSLYKLIIMCTSGNNPINSSWCYSKIFTFCTSLIFFMNIVNFSIRTRGRFSAVFNKILFIFFLRL